MLFPGGAAVFGFGEAANLIFVLAARGVPPDEQVVMVFGIELDAAADPAGGAVSLRGDVFPVDAAVDRLVEAVGSVAAGRVHDFGIDRIDREAPLVALVEKTAILAGIDLGPGGAAVGGLDDAVALVVEAAVAGAEVDGARVNRIDAERGGAVEACWVG